MQLVVAQEMFLLLYMAVVGEVLLEHSDLVI